MSTRPFTSTLPVHKDRRTSLIAAGIFEILLGVGAWGLAGLVLFSVRMAAAQGGPPIASVFSALIFYGVAGAVCIVLGIGSIIAARWARALWLIVSGGWLVCGITGAVFAAFWFPVLFGNLHEAQGGPPPHVRAVMAVAMTAFVAVFMILVPLAIFLFYRSRHVRATCEAAHPNESWTDRCPLPLLAASIWFGLGSVALLGMPKAYGGLFPAFGFFVAGIAGNALWILLVILCAVAAVGLYRRSAAGWWLAMGVVVLSFLSFALTYARANLDELYNAMGLPAVQADQLRQMGLMNPGMMITVLVVSSVPVIVLLLWAKASVGTKGSNPDPDRLSV